MERFEPGQAPDIELELADSAEQAGLAASAARGVGILVGRTVVLQVLTAGVTIVLARLLSPADYGLFALALAVQLVGQRLTELGLPAALIRLPEEPSAKLQRAVVTLMLVVAALLSGAAAVAAFVVLPLLDARNQLVEVIAVALLASPLYALRSRPTIIMERELDFGRVALVETADTLVFNAFALIAAIAGLGAFSLAGAVAAGALISLAVAMRIQAYPTGLTSDLRPIRPLLGFSVGTSAFYSIGLARELGFIALIAGIGGTSLAGFYAMAKRMFSFPIAINSAIFRVSLPTLSRGTEEEQARRTGRMAVSSAIVTALPLALVAGAAYPLTAIVLGDRWLPTVDILLPGSIAMFLAASPAATMLSLSLAQGNSRVPVIAALAEAAVLFAVVLAVRPLDATAVGVALAVAASVQVAVLFAMTHALGRRRVLQLAVTLAIGCVAAGVPLILSLPETLPGLLEALSITLVLWLGLSLAFSRGPLSEILHAIRPALSRFRPFRPAATP